jgi:hypothetical protein
MKNLLLIVFMFAAYLMTSAQLTYEKRIEFELRNGYGSETIYESKLGCFVLESTADDDVDGMVEVKYDLYNKDLELEKTESINIPENMKFDERYYNDEYIFNCYKNKKREFLIIGVSMLDLSVSKTTGVLPFKTNIKDMKVLGDNAYFYASINLVPFIYKVDLSNGKATSIPIVAGAYNPKKLSVDNYQILEKSKEILVLIRAKVKKGVYETYLMRIDNDGNVDKSMKLSGVGDNNVTAISGCRVSDTKMIFTGTYSKDNLMSEGLFFAEMEDGAMSYIRYYNFLDLKDFLSYLSEKKQAKIEKKKDKKEAQGKEFAIDYYIADHDVVILDDGYIFLGEAYYPTYRTETYTTYVNGHPSTSYRTVFDGYQYTHAVVAKFSKEGEMMWDVCFEMWPGYKPFYVKRFIAISDQTASSISMVFTSGNSIVSKSVDFDGNIINDRKWDMMETGQEGDKAKLTNSNIDYWYENYFLAYGSQVVKNTEDKSRRKVYFVNKIGF